MNYFESNPCYDSNYFGFDQIKPPQYSVNPSLNIQNELSQHELFISELIQQKLQNEYAQPFPAIAITFDLPTVEPEDSLRIGDEHLDAIPETESDEFIKSSVENIVPTPSESEDDSEYDVQACDDFTTFSNLLFDADDDFSSNPHHFNVESDLIESLLNHDSLIISSSSKIDSLLDECPGELTLLKSSPPGIDKTDCDPEEEIRLIEKFLYDNSSPRIEEDDYDSERDILILEELLRNDSFSLLEIESFHFDIPSSPHPPAKPLDDDSGKLTVKMVSDISKHDIPMPRLLPTQPTLVSNQEKSPHLLSHRGLKAFQLPSESPMMIYRYNTPVLNVPFLHFYHL
uniref:Reverse transcriptase domain-containing protein n=1 Tax=Tanacetum cinerariifolium TaxID=118510 RepID=A0A699HBK2_TANCI|nr:hypothetical protein [Tanacetum cinerariifolium]